jgi:hypothetical protein
VRGSIPQFHILFAATVSLPTVHLSAGRGVTPNFVGTPEIVEEVDEYSPYFRRPIRCWRERRGDRFVFCSTVTVTQQEAVTLVGEETTGQDGDLTIEVDVSGERDNGYTLAAMAEMAVAKRLGCPTVIDQVSKN